MLVPHNINIEFIIHMYHVIINHYPIKIKFPPEEIAKAVSSSL